MESEAETARQGGQQACPAAPPSRPEAPVSTNAELVSMTGKYLSSPEKKHVVAGKCECNVASRKKSARG